MNLDQFARYLIVIGALIGFVGLVLLLVTKASGFGRLPGDIIAQRGDWRFLLPVAASIFLSIVLTIIVNVIIWIFRR